MSARHALIVSETVGDRFAVVSRTSGGQRTAAADLLRRHRGPGSIDARGKVCLAPDGTRIAFALASAEDEDYDTAVVVEVEGRIQSCLLARHDHVDGLLVAINVADLSAGARLSVMPASDAGAAPPPAAAMDDGWCPRCGDVRLSDDPVFDATEPLTGRRICTPCSKVLDRRKFGGAI